jgi:proteasome beta subunit
MPYYVQLVLVGFDNNGGHVYSLDAAGGAIPDKYTSGGSGSPFVYGVLEDHYRDNITSDEGIDLAIRAIYSAKSRDSASGGLTNVAVISKEGFKEVSKEEIEERTNKIRNLSKK